MTMQYDGESPPRNIKKRRALLLIIVIAVLCSATGIVTYSFFKKDPDISRGVVSATNFMVYLPKNLPDNFTINSQSFKIESEILFFNITGPRSTVYVSQQKNPPVAPDFEKIIEQLSFKKTEIGTGTVVYGLDSKKPRAIYMTNTTLINIHSDEDTPLDVLIDILKQMEPVF